MDIFKYAEEYNADYYDNGKIFKVQEYNRQKRAGENPDSIEVIDAITKETIGYVKKKG